MLSRRRQNAIYQWNFVRNLKRRMRRKARVLPGLFNLDALDRIRTVREFDDAFTAPHHGFRDAADYYHRASSLRVVDRIETPTLIISAEDDPFVPPGQFRDAAVGANPTSPPQSWATGDTAASTRIRPPASTDTGRSRRRSTSPADISPDAAAVSPPRGNRAGAGRKPVPRRAPRA